MTKLFCGPYVEFSAFDILDCKHDFNASLLIRDVEGELS